MPRSLRPLLLSLALLPALAAANPPGWRQGWGLERPAQAPGHTAGTAAFAELKLVRRAGGYSVQVRNRLAGPVQVRLHGQATALEGDPPAPALLQAGEQRSLLWLPGSDGNAHLLLDAYPGDPRAHPDATLYQLPFLAGDVRVSQASNGRYSHHDAQNRYAVDFPLPEGTPVLAARNGRVMQAIEGDGELGCLLRVLHGDGSMAVYGHLQPGSLAVRAGQPVQAGQALATSGNSGHSSGPHLHFAVQANTGLALSSIPFRMRGPQGELKFPREAGPAP